MIGHRLRRGGGASESITIRRSLALRGKTISTYLLDEIDAALADLTEGERIGAVTDALSELGMPSFFHSHPERIDTRFPNDLSRHDVTGIRDWWAAKGSEERATLERRLDDALGRPSP